MLHLVLVSPEIPGNTGNAGRTALAVGARLHLVEPLGFSLEDRQLRRAGLDYWIHVAPIVHADFASFEAAPTARGAPFFFSTEARRSLFDLEIPRDAIFVFGRESVGLPAEIRRRYREALVSLPICDDRVRSLNLSTCVGVAAYEYLRRWGGGSAAQPSGA